MRLILVSGPTGQVACADEAQAEQVRLASAYMKTPRKRRLKTVRGFARN